MNKILEAENLIKQALEVEQFADSAEGVLAKIYLETAQRLVGQARALLVSGSEEQVSAGR